MWSLKIWLTVIVVLACTTFINTSKASNVKRHGKVGVKYGCRHHHVCKNGGTCIRKFGKCICPEGWRGRRCNVPACKNKNFCKNGGTLVCSGRSRRSRKCICADGWSGRRCGKYIGDEQNEYYQEFVSYIMHDSQMQQYPAYVFMTSDTPTNVNITTSETLLEDQMTSFNSSITIPYPDFGTNVSDVTAIRIRSKENITVAVSAHHDVTTLIPTDKLSTSYIILTPVGDPSFQHVAVTVTALHDNTSITVSDFEESISDDYTLNALETHIQDNSDGDFKVYRVESSKPVAIFSGTDCISDTSCSNMVEQMPPMNQLDTIYIIPPLINMPLAVISYTSPRSTTVTVENDSISAVAGKVYQLVLTPDSVSVMRSADPILVTSYAFTEDITSGFAYWTVVPGVNQYLPRYKVIIQNGWNDNYIALIIRKSAVGSLRLNDQAIDTNTIRFEKDVFVEDLEYSVIIAEVTEGELALNSADDTPFGLMVYGSRPFAGYGFAGNVILN